MVPTNELKGYARHSGRKRIAVALAVVVALGAVVYLSLKPAPAKPVPEFNLPRLDGGELSSAELRGSPVVLNFFASWCGPCKEEAPLLERTWRRYRDRGVRFVGVNVRDTARAARHFVGEYGLSYPIVRDPQERLTGDLRVFGLPQTFFVTSDWKLLDVSAGKRLGTQGDTTTLGAVSPDELQHNIDRLLQEAEAVAPPDGYRTQGPPRLAAALSRCEASVETALRRGIGGPARHCSPSDRGSG